MRPPFDLKTVNQATDLALASGHRVLQTHQYAPTEQGQIDYLLSLIRPKPGAVVLDAGCGVGEVSRLMHAVRPDLHFVLLNISEYQLSHCPRGSGFTHLPGDCHEIPLPDQSVDVAMYSSTLCQLDTQVALAEAFRVLRPGGTLFINDMVRTHLDNTQLEDLFAARVLTADELLGFLSPFEVHEFFVPPTVGSVLVDLLGEVGLEHLMNPVYPVIAIATRKL